MIFCPHAPLSKCICTALICTWLCLTGIEFASANTGHPDFETLRKLSETQQDQAIRQLETLNSNFSDKDSYADRREILDILISLYYRNSNDQKVQEMIEQLSQIEKKYGDLKARVLVLNYEAKLFERKNNYVESLDLIEQALALTTKSDDNLLINKLENTAAELYSSLGNFQVAIQHQQNAQTVLDAIKVDNWQTEFARAKTLFLQAYLYYSINDQQTALNYLGKAAEIAEKLNTPILLGQILNSRGASFSYLKQWNLAKKEFLASLKIAKTSGNAAAEALNLTNLADVSLNTGDFPACLRYAQQAIQIAQRLNDTYADALAKGNLGICHIYTGNVNEGKEEVNKSIDFLSRANELSVIEATLDESSSAYAKSGMYQDAWNALQQKLPITEKMEKERHENTAFEMKVHYDYVKRQKIKEQTAFKNQLLDIENENRNLRNKLLVLISALGLTIGIFGFQYYRRTRIKLRHLEINKRNRQYQSSRDPLTGLLNRRAFQAVIESRKRIVERRSADQSQLYDAVVMLDIDHFKQINEQFGRELGDTVLKEISERLQDILREKDMLIRWGGEEFLIYLNAVPADRVVRIIERELNEFARLPVKHNDQKIRLTASAGYILLPARGARGIIWDKVMELVEAALAMAKSNGCNQAYGVTSKNANEATMIALLSGSTDHDLSAAVANGIVSLVHSAGPSSVSPK